MAIGLSLPAYALRFLEGLNHYSFAVWLGNEAKGLKPERRRTYEYPVPSAPTLAWDQLGPRLSGHGGLFAVRVVDNPERHSPNLAASQVQRMFYRGIGVSEELLPGDIKSASTQLDSLMVCLAALWVNLLPRLSS